MDDIETRRRTVADAIFEAYDFGHQVRDAGPWQESPPGDAMVRTVLFDDADPSRSALSGSLTVRFAGPDTAEPEDAFAVVGGERVGNPGSPLSSYGAGTPAFGGR